MAKKPGLYANIAAKRKPGTKGAPTAAAFKASAKTAKKPAKKGK
jgi:hypothetical protein